MNHIYLLEHRKEIFPVYRLKSGHCLGPFCSTRVPSCLLFCRPHEFWTFKIDFAMDADKTSTTPGGEIVDITDNTDSFTKVKSKKCQKRKREQDGADMDTEETVVSKRPQFPPISGDKLKVSSVF